VEPDTTIGIVEVMKLMNAVPAGVAGEVVEVLVRDGELVEYDQPLLRVRPLAGAA
jgi:acetyl-CoA carboxylase biotin carboxyl carrier protein